MKKGIKRVVTTFALSAILASSAVPCFAHSNETSFHFEYTGQQGSVNGLKNGVFRFLDKGKVQLDVTGTSNVTSKNPSVVTLYRYRTTKSDVCFGSISVSGKGTTTFAEKADKACDDYYLTASGGVNNKQVKVSGTIRNK